MEYLVTRVFDGGRVMPAHVRTSGTVRGSLTVRQEDDRRRNRTTLVARLTIANGGMRTVPPLYDAALISSTGDVWTLAGYERITSGALQQEYFLGQSWIITPAPLEDLRKAENEWAVSQRYWPNFSTVRRPERFRRPETASTYPSNARPEVR